MRGTVARRLRREAQQQEHRGPVPRYAWTGKNGQQLIVNPAHPRAGYKALKRQHRRKEQ